MFEKRRKAIIRKWLNRKLDDTIYLQGLIDRGDLIMNFGIGTQAEMNIRMNALKYLFEEVLNENLPIVIQYEKKD